MPDKIRILPSEIRLLRMKEFYREYNCPKTTAYREISAKRLRVVKLGTATRIARVDAEAWAASLPTIEGGAA